MRLSQLQHNYSRRHTYTHTQTHTRTHIRENKTLFQPKGLCISKKIREKSENSTNTSRSQSQTPKGRGNSGKGHKRISANQTNVKKNPLRLALSSQKRGNRNTKWLKTEKTRPKARSLIFFELEDFTLSVITYEIYERRLGLVP